MRIYKLNQVCCRLTGNIEHFFNGLSSNTTMAKHNAFLNQHGRIIATFSQRKINDDQILIVMSSIAYEPLMQHLQKYLMLSKVECHKLNHHVYYDCDGRSNVDGFIFPQEHGRIIATTDVLDNTINESEFTQFRLLNHIPLQGIDYTDQMILNVSDRFVSFDKGCFLGQEPVSKVHNRAKPTWVLQVKNEENCTPEELEKMTSRVTNRETGKREGFVFVKNDE